jgi:hypothetical protein
MKICLVLTFLILLCSVAVANCENGYCNISNNTTKYAFEPAIQNNMQILGADGHEILLLHNPDATNVDYNSVLNFIRSDNTSKTPYEDGVFTCGDYAELVQNNAEKAGINCGFVGIDFFDNDLGHACNVFNTTDKGLMFVDCTKYRCIVNIVEGEEYLPELIDDNETILTPIGVVKNYVISW